MSRTKCISHYFAWKYSFTKQKEKRGKAQKRGKRIAIIINGASIYKANV